MDRSVAGALSHVRNATPDQVTVVDSDRDDDTARSGAAGRTEAQRAGIRKTVAIVVVFVLAVFAWTIFGRLIE